MSRGRVPEPSRVREPICPIGGKAHGRPYPTDTGRWYCPHREHDGNATTPQTACFFSDDQIHSTIP